MKNTGAIKLSSMEKGSPLNARKKARIGLDLFKGKTTVHEASSLYHVDPEEIHRWISQTNGAMKMACGISINELVKRMAKAKSANS